MVKLTKREFNYLVKPLEAKLTQKQNELSEAEMELEDMQVYLEVSEVLEPEIKFLENLINKLNQLKEV